MKGLLRTSPYFLIVLYKGLKAVFLLLVAFTLARAVEQHLPGNVQRVLDHWFVAPEREFYSNLADRLAAVTPKALHWAASASFLCGLLTLVETVGLIRRTSLLVWLTIADSGLFLSLGVFAMTRRFTPGALLLAAINTFIVWYLVTRRPKTAKSTSGSASAEKKPKKKPE